MTDLAWFDTYPPSRLTLAEVTRFARVLSGRPRRGLVQQLTPIVVFELRLSRLEVRWLVGTDSWTARSLPGELLAQLPHLGLARQPEPQRPRMTTAREVRFTGLPYPLRLDTGAAVAAGLYELSGRLRSDEHAVVQWIVGPSNDRRQPPVEVTNPLVALGFQHPVTPTGEQQLWRTKVAEPLFGVRGRIGVQVTEPKRAALLLRSLLTGLWQASGPNGPLKASHQSSRTARLLHDVMGRSRTWSSLVNAAELAVLIGWPVDGAEVPGKPLLLNAPPTRLLLAADAAPSDDRLLGTSLHPGSLGQPVRLPVKTALSHLHLIGPTGSGKSTLLTHLIVADARADRGVLVLEPKGDLITDVLRRLPPERHNDVVVIEPSDLESVVGLNPLSGPRDQAERRADELLALFRDLFGNAVGPRSSDVLLHTLITAARLEDGALTDVPTLLVSPGFRRKALSAVSDPLVLGPFWAGFDALSDRERATVLAPLMNKLRVLTTRTPIRRMLGQARPGFGIESLLSDNKIVLINLNKGVVGPETGRLLGSLVLTQLWRAIQRRSVTPQAQRQPVMVVVDEWQDYAATLDFSDVLSTSRGLGVGWTLAHQHLSQLSSELQSAVLANARSRVAFQPAQKDAAALAAVLGAGVTTADLERLGAYQAVARVLVNNAPSAAFAVATQALPRPTSSAARLRRQSAERYGQNGPAVDRFIQNRWQPDLPPDAPIGARRRSSK